MTDRTHRLRPLSMQDLEQVRQWRNHPDVHRYLYTRHEIGADEHQAWFERARYDACRHLLVYEKHGRATGFVNLTVADPTAGRVDWGFYLAPDAPRGSGQGLGVTALAYAFTTLNAHKVCGEALSDNQRSIRLHDRLGFTREARLRDHYFDGHRYHDVIGFGLLVADWPTRQGDERP